MLDNENEFNAMAVAGALSTNYARDARSFLPLLAAILQASMPDETTIEYKKILFSKEKTIRKVSISIDPYVYEIEDPGNGRLISKRIQIVRNIVLKREPMPVDLWLEALSAKISERAKTNEKAYFALKNLTDY